MRGQRLQRGDPEHQAQATLFTWAALESHKRPELALMFAIANGGHRHIAVARKLKAEGVKAGIPDIFLPVCQLRYEIWGSQKIEVGTNYHGLFIELKVGKNKPTPQQVWWHEMLALEGYKVVVAYGWEKAKDAIVDYLEGRG